MHDRCMFESNNILTREAAVADARRRDLLNRETFAVRRNLRAFTADEHALRVKMAAMVEREKRAETAIEGNWRAEHWGREPERPWAWHAPNGASAP
jgi:hypothetical protein